jgi:hypothetical protein
MRRARPTNPIRTVDDRSSSGCADNFCHSLGKIKDPPSFRAISKYLQAYYNVLSDEELYGVLVSLSSALLYKHPSPDILGIAREHQIKGVVRQLSMRSGARLEEPLRRLRAVLEN